MTLFLLVEGVKIVIFKRKEIIEGVFNLEYLEVILGCVAGNFLIVFL